MRIDIHLHIELPSEVLGLLGEMSRKLDLIIHKENQIMSAMTDALDEAERNAQANSDADDSAEKLLIALAAQIADLKTNGTDPATLTRIQALSSAIKDRASRLSAAVVAGTAAAPTP